MELMVCNCNNVNNTQVCVCALLMMMRSSCIRDQRFTYCVCAVTVTTVCMYSGAY
jgi:hypothetical protein